MYAAQIGDLPVFERMVSMGADPLLSDAEGLACLHIAAANGQTKVVQFLVEAGCEINQRSKDGLTALDLAIRNN